MRYLSALAAIILLSVISNGAALAHATMSKSLPAEGSTIRPGLAEITIGFTQSVRIMVVKVRNEHTKADVETNIKPATSYTASYSFAVQPLEVGDHAVSWTAIAKDGHVMKGTLKFIVRE